jgi:hypothetical protein
MSIVQGVVNPNFRVEEYDIMRELKALLKVLWILILVTLGFQAHAQQIWNYSDGNSAFDTQITLASALPQNGTVQVTPQSVSFGLGLSGFTSQFGFIFEPGFVGTPVFQFTTVNGAITSFDMALNMTTPGTNTPTNLMLTLSSQGDSYFQQTYGEGCEFSACLPLSATSSPGTWTDPHAAPEMDMLVAITGITLLFGCVAILKGKS